jgi:DNA-binding response OmpR family regulator
MAGSSPPELLTQRPGACIWWLEDDRRLCELLVPRLRACGWQLSMFHKVADFWAALRGEEPDLLLLDRMLTGSNGADVLRDLRQQGFRFPILVLSALGSPQQRIEGLELGANDYLPKPFRSKELIWRIERLLQSMPPRPIHSSVHGGIVSIGPLTFDPRHGSLRDGSGAQLLLSRGDCALLLALCHASGSVVSREQLTQASGSLVDVSTSRTLDVRLSRLRRQLRHLSSDGVSIEAVRGQGYRLALPAHQLAIVPNLSLLAMVAPGLVLSSPGLLVWLVFASCLLLAGTILLTQVLLPLAKIQKQLCRLSPDLSFPVLPVEGLPPLRALIVRLNSLHASQVLRLEEWRWNLRTLVHDLRAPLARLMLRQEEVRADQLPEQSVLDGLISDLDLIHQLLQQLGALAEASQEPAGPQLLALDELCQRLVLHYRPSSIQAVVPHLLLQLNAGELQRVLHNLIDNALEHGSPPVFIGAHTVPGALVLEVRDHGPARPASGSKLVDAVPHQGLGLALALHFCLSHGGWLELDRQDGGGHVARLRIDSRYLAPSKPDQPAQKFDPASA